MLNKDLTMDESKETEKYSVDMSKPLQWFKKSEGEIYVGQWDNRYNGYMIDLKDFSEDVQKSILKNIEKHTKK